jgi:hypothetical protein
MDSLQTAGLLPGRSCIPFPPDEAGFDPRVRREGALSPVALSLPGRLAARMPGNRCYHEQKAT